jgi:hypothetical protein
MEVLYQLSYIGVRFLKVHLLQLSHQYIPELPILEGGAENKKRRSL